MGPTGKAAAALALVFALLTTTAPQSVEAAQKEQKKAAAAFKKGKRLLKSKRYDEANQSFQRANDLVPRAKYLLYIGRSEAGAGHPIKAIEMLNRFLDQADDSTPKKQMNKARENLKAELSKIGLLNVTGPDGGTVHVDGTENGTLPMESSIPVTAGENHSVWVVYDGSQLPVEVASLEPGQSTTLHFKEPVEDEVVDASDEPSESPTQTDTPSPRPLRTWGWVGTGVGAALAIGGVIAGSVALSKDDDLVKTCGDDPCPDKKDEVDTRDTLANTSTALLIVGGTVATAGITLLVIDAVRNKKENAVSLAPTLSPAYAGATLRWRF